MTEKKKPNPAGSDADRTKEINDEAARRAAAEAKKSAAKSKPKPSRAPKLKGKGKVAADEARPAAGPESTPEAGAEEESKEDAIRREARALMDASERAAEAEDLAHPTLPSIQKNSANAAQIVLERFFVKDDFPTITYYRETWYSYYKRLWSERSEDDVDQLLHERLLLCRQADGDGIISDFNPSSRNVSELKKQIALKVGIKSHFTPPCEYGEDKIWRNIDARGQMVTRGEVVDMLTGETKSNKRLFIPNGPEWKYNPIAKPPVEWLKFLKSLKTSEENISLLQEWMGYLLSGDAWAHKGLILVGPKRGGKGVIGHLNSMLLGESMVTSPSLRSIGGTHGLQNFLSKRLCLISDARLSLKQDIMAVIEVLLQIIGGDKVDVNPKNKPIITVKLGTRVMMLSNSLPAFVDDSDAIKSRFMIIRLTESFYGREDTGLLDRLCDELPSIALWSMEGYQRLRARGKFAEPQSSDDERKQWELDNNPVARFVRDCCVLGVNENVANPELYEAYTAWCEDQGERVLALNTLKGKLKDYLGSKIKPDYSDKNVIATSGLGLKPDGQRPPTV